MNLTLKGLLERKFFGWCGEYDQTLAGRIYDFIGDRVCLPAVVAFFIFTILDSVIEVVFSVKLPYLFMLQLVAFSITVSQ